MGAARMGVGNRDLLLQSAAVLESDDDTRAVILVERCRLGEAPRPLRVLHRAHLAPQAHGVIARRALRRVARLVVPAAVLQRDGEDVHDGMIEGLAARLGVVLLRSEEHTSELQSLMRISYAVFCLKKKNT